jgi:hypothetical protein
MYGRLDPAAIAVGAVLAAQVLQRGRTSGDCETRVAARHLGIVDAHRRVLVASD